MGVKNWMLVYAQGSVAQVLRAGAPLERARSAQEAARLFPKDTLVPLPDARLTQAFPPRRELMIGCFEGVTIVAAKEFGGDRPSRLDPRFIAAAAGRTVYLHAMHSVVDWFAYGVWQQGRLVRALSVAPDNGVMGAMPDPDQVPLLRFARKRSFLRFWS
jgi:hypothetical protein